MNTSALAQLRRRGVDLLRINSAPFLPFKGDSKYLPSLIQLRQHVRKGGLIGMIPGPDSIAVMKVSGKESSVVFDALRGYDPLCISRSAGNGFLFWFGDHVGELKGFLKWEFLGARGSVVCGKRWFILADLGKAYVGSIQKGRVSDDHPLPLELLRGGAQAHQRTRTSRTTEP